MKTPCEKKIKNNKTGLIWMYVYKMLMFRLSLGALIFVR
jgi:hypothetical protein